MPNETTRPALTDPAPPPEPESDERLRKQARAMARSLGITVYVRDGRIYQHGPGQKFKPPPAHGHTVRLFESHPSIGGGDA